jgi:hypothetical protein
MKKSRDRDRRDEEEQEVKEDKDGDRRDEEGQ